MKILKRVPAILSALCMFGSALAFAGCSESGETVVLRVCNWEEYIDLGGWSEVIEIENAFTGEDGIIGKNSVMDDFTEWFNETHDYNVRVDYSTFGTNEDLYNRLSLGDDYDLVCPSDYMIMKLIAEDKVERFSDNFFGEENSYYTRYVSPYIADIFQEYGWDGYAACYMWGTTGLVYNPEEVDAQDVSTFGILKNEDYYRQVTVKDNVRDAYFAALGILNYDILVGGNLTAEERSAVLNDVDSETIALAEDLLKRIKENVYSFETDSGKADMVTGKVLSNYQWSGDAVYIMDEADEDDFELWYSVPDECTNLWFDGWVMLKSGIDGNEQRKEAAEAFVNFVSRPDIAVRNMYYIGYTSSIADDTVLEYIEYNYAAEDDAEFTCEYDLSYFFGEEVTVIADAAEFDFEDGEQTIVNRGRQLFAQYPPQNVIERSVIMLDFGEKLSEINQMWINVRCLDLVDIPAATYAIVSVVIAVIVAAVILYAYRYKIFKGLPPKKGYKKV